MADQKIIRKTYEAVETKAAAGEDRTLIVTISTSNPDRSKDVVVPEGMESDHYLRNPVVAAFHDYHQPAIGRTLQLEQSEGRITAKVEFLPKGIYPLADILYEQYKAGFMNAWSIGIIPKERTNIDPDSFMGGNRFDKWELLEYSDVQINAGVTELVKHYTGQPDQRVDTQVDEDGHTVIKTRIVPADLERNVDLPPTKAGG